MAFTSVQTYIASFPSLVQERLQQIRTLSQQLVPEAEESMNYGVPTFKLHGAVVIHFAAFKAHIGLYPFISLPAELEQEVAVYRSGKATLQFKHAEPLPMELIARLIRYRLESLAK